MTEVTVCFGGNPVEFAGLPDDEFLQSIRWTRNAPASLSKAAKSGDVEEFCQALADHRCAAHVNAGLKRAAAFAAERPSLWSLSAFADSPRTAALVEIHQAFGSAEDRKKKKKRKTEAISLNGTGSANGTGKPAKSKKKSQLSHVWNNAETALAEWLAAGVPPLPFELLLLNEMLLGNGRHLSIPLRWRLWRTALVGSLELTEQLPEPEGSQSTDEQRLLIAGELPFQVGLLFAGVKGAAALQRLGAKLLTTELLDSTDTDGTPQAQRIQRLPLWLASLVRAKQWADGFGETLFTKEGAERYRELIRVVAPLCRADGRIALGNGVFNGDESTPITRLLVSASLSAGFAKKSNPMRYLSAVEKHAATGGGTKRPSLRSTEKADSKKSAKKKDRDKPPVAQSDWAQLACLRSDWSLAADTLVVAHDGGLPRIELSAGGVPLISGVWDIALSLNDEPVDTSGDWSCSCWFSDKDADYIELQNTLDNGTVIDRQVLLSRNDHFALLADCISTGTDARMEYAQRLPTLENVAIEADVPTRECRLKQNGVVARAFPLALDADRVRSTPGSFGNEGGRLELSQSAIGGLYAPLLLDWSPKRTRAYAEWRRLTVAEDGKKLTSADASGHRIRLGNQHLFIFRNLTKGRFSRSVLGQHTNHESVIGRFAKDGQVAPILLVE